jgi:N-acetylmuramoyl-L-alanine amidase
MRELSADLSGTPLSGLYEGSYTVGRRDSLDQASIRIVLETADDTGKEETLTLTPRGTLTAGERRIVRIMEATEDDTGLYIEPARGERFLSTGKGTRLKITGRRNDMLRAQLSPARAAWVPDENTRLVARTGKLPAAKLRAVTIADDGQKREAKVSLAVARHGKDEVPPLPFRVDASGGDNSLLLTVYGLRGDSFCAPLETGKKARSSWQASLDTYFTPKSLVRELRCEPADAESVNLEFTLSDPLWGYKAGFDRDSLDFRIRTRPILIAKPEGPLSGITIILDPGHGGQDSGAVGSSGLCESDINLVIARRVAALLRAAQATVLMTRESDEFVALNARVERIATSGADLFLSIHCNSVAETEDPFMSQGAKVFYFFPQGEKLARRIRVSLAEAIESDIPLLGATRGDFRVIRACSQMPGALIECLFLSNPEDEMRLLAPASLDRMCVGIYKGLLAFLQDAGSPQDRGTKILADRLAGVGLGGRLR